MSVFKVIAMALPLSAQSVVANAADASFPARPIRLISPFTPGGGNDFVSRAVALAMTKNIGQSVVVDNRPGANTIMGMELVAKAAPDGYTLIMTSSTQAINATLYPKLPYDSITSFAPVTIVGSSPLIIAVPPSSSIKSVTDLIAAARSKPGELTYPSAGTGNATHLGGELFASMANVKLTHVPYKGSGPGLTDLSAGRLAVAFSTALSVVPFVNGGRLRAIAVTSAKRSSFMPDLPTVAESGLPGYEAGSWYGVVAPAKTPRAIIARLHAEIIKVLALPEVRDRLVSQGIDPVGHTPDQFAAYIRAEILKWAKIIKSTGVTAD